MIDKNKLAFNAFWWENLQSEDSIMEVVDILARLGYKGVEWKETCFSTEECIEKKLKSAVKISNEAGLEVPAAVILRSFSDPSSAQKSVEEVGRFIHYCAEAGITKVNLPSGGPLPKQKISDDWWAPALYPASKAWDTLQSSLEILSSIACDCGVFLVLESVAGHLVHDYFTTSELLRKVDSLNLCITMDPSHYQLYSNDVPWVIRQFGKEKIKHVHLKDVIGRPGEIGEDFIFPLLGEGAIDWNGFFGALDEIEYEGYLSVEFESWKYMNDILNNNAIEAARISLQAANALIDRYNSKLNRGGC